VSLVKRNLTALAQIAAVIVGLFSVLVGWALPRLGLEAPQEALFWSAFQSFLNTQVRVYLILGSIAAAIIARWAYLKRKR
jgi:hypothetical protein